ncbi:MAG: hypothetical protein EBX52_07115 [Proteobacteria bacterium]|nr:hypothetical protein [Pseudomonadota bacterium]
MIATCANPKKGAKHVPFFKQWHAAPGVDTRHPRTPVPQEKNLEAIYAQLDAWIRAKKVTEVVAEGCTGEIDSKSNYKVNGWTLPELELAKSDPAFPKIVTSVPLKLKAAYHETVHIPCGDSEALVKEQLLAFSDARGDLGYLSRILQYKDDSAKVKSYLTDVIEILKLPKTASVNDAIDSLKTDLNKTIERIHATIDERNAHLVSVIEGAKASEVAVVYGGMHATGVQKLLEAKGIACTIVEPAS